MPKRIRFCNKMLKYNGKTPIKFLPTNPPSLGLVVHRQICRNVCYGCYGLWVTGYTKSQRVWSKSQRV